jgi:hypothetical protein
VKCKKWKARRMKLEVGNGLREPYRLQGATQSFGEVNHAMWSLRLSVVLARLSEDEGVGVADSIDSHPSTKPIGSWTWASASDLRWSVEEGAWNPCFTSNAHF